MEQSNIELNAFIVIAQQHKKKNSATYKNTNSITLKQ